MRSSSDPLGPRVFPVLLAAVSRASLADLPVRPRPVGDLAARPLLVRCIGATVLVLVAALILEPLGFAASMFVLTAGVARILGASWRASLIGGLVQAALWYFVFGYLLEVYLPTGELFSSSSRG